MFHQNAAPMLGSFLQALSIPVCLYGLLSAPLSFRLRDGRWYRSAQQSGLLLCLLLSTCVVLLVGSFVTNNYAIAYVSGYSSSTLPLFYKITGLWAGLDGSILFWTWIVSVFNAIVILRHRNDSAVIPLLPGIQTTMHAILLFFLCLLVYADNPFTLLPEPLMEGKGLNPLLQNISMVIHPPCIYLGFTLASVPFAFALSALATRRLDSQWIRQCRFWSITCWFFLTLGNLLGSQWAYVELGWGGFWAWDPVENAAIMPWFTSSAFIHSVIVQEKRGMLKVWNMVLVILTFLLTIFGTFLTRSGVVTSVHSFSNSTVGPYFVGFMIVAGVLAFGLLIRRLNDLKPDHAMLSWISKEGAFVLNNVVLIGCAFTVCWGTMFPSLSEWLTGKRVSVGPPFFNKVMAPLGIALLILAGVGPLIAWKKAGRRALQSQFLIPTGLATVVTVLTFILGIRRWYAVGTVFGATFVVVSIAMEFFRGYRMLSLQSGHTFLSSIAVLLLSNGRKYGGYIVHLGITLIFIGIAGAVYQLEKDFVLKANETFTYQGYSVTFKRLEVKDSDHKVEYIAHVDLMAPQWSEPRALAPARHFYKASEQPSTEVSIYHAFFEDVYLTFGAYSDQTSEVSLRINLNPLVSYLWLGGMITLMGSILILIPRTQANALLAEGESA